MESTPTHLPGVLWDELVIDSFAGGGGASLGIEWGIGRAVNVAINHDPEAVAMHRANHPLTDHYCQDVWSADPVTVTKGRPVALGWFSPDCTYHSKARGSKPIRPKNAKRRDLAWVIIKWAKAVRMRVIMLENVEEFRDWGPLVDGRPCKVRKGKTFRAWKQQLKNAGYEVQDRILRACDYGSPTIRKRLFVIARCDGQPIVWPEVTHGSNQDSLRRARKQRSAHNQESAAEHRRHHPRLTPFRTAADCIDWVLRCPSIFLNRAEATAYHQATGDRIVRPLKPKTMDRIRNGLVRYVINAAKPFIVRCNHGPRKGEHFRGQPVDQPFCTATASRDAHGLVVPYTVGAGGSGYAGKPKSMGEPLGTVMAHDRRSLVAANLSHMYTSNTAGGQGRPDLPIKTIVAGGNHAHLVHAFLQSYYGEGSGKTGRDVAAPLPTVTTKDRTGLVTVNVDGEPHMIIDVGMRMLTPRELYRCQGFPDSYVIDPVVNGKKLTKSAQVRMCGNSVCPQVAAALVRANLVEVSKPSKKEVA